ncbi:MULTISPECIES: hypothetical protein [Hyphobacterium]|uniref:Uncharacterized protein n=1 Tax=Hyphobacterium vulgare TaxID=1736751 RepID=A0ABV6ZWJ9_9PROT
MIVPGRFIVIDNTKAHLDALSDVFVSLRSPCRPILFDPSEDIEVGCFEGARAIFCDVHLLAGIAGTTDEMLFANIIAVLARGVPRAGMPYVLCLWTRHEDKRDAFVAYLERSISEENRHAIPLMVIALPKTDFMRDLRTGEVRDPSALKEAVKEKLTESPQLTAILEWESSVHLALNAMLNTLTNTARTLEPGKSLPEALDVLLSHLAVGAAGRPRALENPQSAISAALAPILADRISHAQRAASPVWRSAITKIPAIQNLQPLHAATILTMVHVAIEPGPSPLEWGGVHLPPEKYIATSFRRNHGCAYGDFIKSLTFTDGTAPDGSSLRLIRVGAACDYAQKNQGPVPMALALEIPIENLTKNKKKDIKSRGYLWISPPFKNHSGTGVFLVSNLRYLHYFSTTVARKYKALYRLREPLLMELISRISTYISRPGILNIETK